jgi:hypothetical protein
MSAITTCGRKGIPAGGVETETCEQPAAVVILPRYTNDGEPLGHCSECAWYMLSQDATGGPARPMRVDMAALGWTEAEMREAWSG